MGKKSGGPESPVHNYIQLNETNDIDKIKTVVGERDKLRGNYEHMPKYQQSRVVVIVVPAIHPGDAWPMVRNVQSVARSTTLERYVEM